MLSVIILTFNSVEFIKSCLDSLFAQDNQGFEVIVVDNGSGDQTVDLVKKRYPQVVLIENKQNLGACIARNQGIQIAQGRWILTLDCDVTLEKDFLSEISRTIKDLSPKIGILQPKILKANRNTIYSIGIFLSSLRRFYDIGKGKFDNGQFSTPRYVFGACSAAALYKKEMLKTIKEDTGYFDERFFFLVEDVDLAWRAQRKGWKALYCPEAVCYHFGNSSGTSRKIRQYLCFRNRYYSIIKNDSFRDIIVTILLSLGYDSGRILYFIFTDSFRLEAIREIYKFRKNRPKERLQDYSIRDEGN